MWLNQLKIAIVQKDMELLDSLLGDVPQLQDEKEIESAFYLLQEAVALMQSLKDETAFSMRQIKRNLDFLNSTQVNRVAKFDVTS